MKASKKTRLPHFLFGSKTAALLLAFVRYPGIAFSKILKAGTLLAFSVLTIPFRLWESLRYNRRIRNTELHPEPLFVIGYWQSGTSPLHFHLCLDPRFGYLTTLHAAFPWSFLSTGWILRGILKRIIKNKDRGSDSYRLHEGLPQGSDWTMATCGDLSIYHAYTFPQYAERVFRRTVLMEDLSAKAIERWKRRYRFHMQKIALATGKSRVVLRNASDTARISHLLAMFPKAKFVRIVRDPYEVCQASNDRWKSMCRIWALQRVDLDRLGALTIDFYELMMRKFDEERRRIPEGQLVTVRHEDLMTRPVETMELLYRELGLDDFETVRPRIEEYIRRESGSLAGEQSEEMSESMREEIRTRLEFVFHETGYPLHPEPTAEALVTENR